MILSSVCECFEEEDREKRKERLKDKETGESEREREKRRGACLSMTGLNNGNIYD